MATTLTVTLTDADAARVTAALPANTTLQQLAIAWLTGIVQSYESQQNQQQFASSYVPINPA